MRLKIVLMLIMCLALTTHVWAEDTKKIKMTDGSIITGDIISKEGEYYVINSYRYGVRRIKESQILSITNATQTEPYQSLRELEPVTQAPVKRKANQPGKRTMLEKNASKKIWQPEPVEISAEEKKALDYINSKVQNDGIMDKDMQRFLQDQDFQEIIRDPMTQEYIKQGNKEAIINSKKFKRLMKNRNARRVLKDLEEE